MQILLGKGTEEGLAGLNRKMNTNHFRWARNRKCLALINFKKMDTQVWPALSAMKANG